MTTGGLLKFLGILTIVLCINYIVHVTYDKYKDNKVMKENFQDQTAKEDEVEKESQKEDTHTWITDPQLFYDTFYADIYDQLCKQKERTKAKLAILQTIWKSTPIESWSVLDLGCGRNLIYKYFKDNKKMSIIGYDYL
jgi:hypothetical protein